MTQHGWRNDAQAMDNIGIALDIVAQPGKLEPIRGEQENGLFRRIQHDGERHSALPLQSGQTRLFIHAELFGIDLVEKGQTKLGRDSSKQIVLADKACCEQFRVERSAGSLGACRNRPDIVKRYREAAQDRPPVFQQGLAAG
ncbi:MAG TPA: hypothetical protein VFT89_12835 [Rhizobiaceae bacterium]|nr:hypothetical protein [Rhizobiaceae bacterium]